MQKHVRSLIPQTMVFQRFPDPQNGCGWRAQRKKLWFFCSWGSKADFGTLRVLASSLPRAFLDTYGSPFWDSVVLFQHACGPARLHSCACVVCVCVCVCTCVFVCACVCSCVCVCVCVCVVCCVLCVVCVCVCLNVWKWMWHCARRVASHVSARLVS